MHDFDMARFMMQDEVMKSIKLRANTLDYPSLKILMMLIRLR